MRKDEVLSEMPQRAYHSLGVSKEGDGRKGVLLDLALGEGTAGSFIAPKLR